MPSADQAIYGGQNALDFPSSGRKVAKPISINEIRADPQQPRKLASQVRGNWSGAADGVVDVLRRWYEMAVAELPEFTLDWLGNSSEQEAMPDAPDPLKYPLAAAFMELARLADSILHNGLLEPIAVIAQPLSATMTPTYTLSYGERRWLAFHLLHLHTGDPQWLKIPALTDVQADAWAQAAENSARESLNAIGRARQYALLMMAAWENNGRVKLHIPITHFQREQDFYRQALEHKSLPNGYGQRMLTYLGVKSRADLSRLRDLLNLDVRLWTLGDDWNAPLDVLLRCAKLDPDQGVALLQQWRTPNKKASAGGERTYREAMSSFRQMIGAFERGERIDPAHLAKVKAVIAELEQRVSSSDQQTS